MSGIYLCVVFDYLFVMLFDYCCDVQLVLVFGMFVQVLFGKWQVVGFVCEVIIYIDVLLLWLCVVDVICVDLLLLLLDWFVFVLFVVDYYQCGCGEVVLLVLLQVLCDVGCWGWLFVLEVCYQLIEVGCVVLFDVLFVCGVVLCWFVQVFVDIGLLMLFDVCVFYLKVVVIFDDWVVCGWVDVEEIGWVDMFVVKFVDNLLINGG